MPVKKIIVEKANRLYQLPPDILSFARLEKQMRLIRKPELVDLASFRWPIGSGEINGVTDSLRPATAEELQTLREAVAEWYQSEHNARLNPSKEVFIGSSISSSLLALALAFIDNSDIAFVPALGLPTYRRVIAACGGEAVSYNLTSRNGWRPDFERVTTQLGRVARILFLNSPHNPTGSQLSEREMGDLVWLAAKENIMIVNDGAYQTFDERKSVSLMSVTGGSKAGVEAGSFSYHFGLPRLPLSFVVGNRDVISGLKQATKLINPILFAEHIRIAVEGIRKYPLPSLKQFRRDVVSKAGQVDSFLKMLDLEPAGQDSVPFVWARLPKRAPATLAANRLLKRSRILVTPGTAFGEVGEGFVRVSLTAPAEQYEEAVERLKKRRQIPQKTETE